MDKRLISDHFSRQDHCSHDVQLNCFDFLIAGMPLSCRHENNSVGDIFVAISLWGINDWTVVTVYEYQAMYKQCFRRV